MCSFDKMLLKQNRKIKQDIKAKDNYIHDILDQLIDMQEQNLRLQNKVKEYQKLENNVNDILKFDCLTIECEECSFYIKDSIQVKGCFTKCLKNIIQVGGFKNE